MAKVVIDKAILERVKLVLLSAAEQSYVNALTMSEISNQHLLAPTPAQLSAEFERGCKAGIKSVHAALKHSPLTGKYGNVLTPFVERMEQELKANSHKGDRPGWLNLAEDKALLEIYWHVSKLQRAVMDGDEEGIAEHSADVANLSMMLADICGQLKVLE